MKIDIPHFGNSFSVEASQVIYAGGAIDSGIRRASLKKEMSDLDVEKERQELQLTRLRNTGKVMNRKIVTILHLPEETVIIPDSTVLASEIPVLCEQYWHDKANSGNISLRQSDITDFMTSFADLRTLHRILSIPAYRHPRQHAGLRHIVGMAHVPL